MREFLIIIVVCLCFASGEERASKQIESIDSPITHTIIGGGLIDKSFRKHGKTISGSADDAVALLQEKESESAVKSHTHLLEKDGKYSVCYENGVKGQEACNQTSA